MAQLAQEQLRHGPTDFELNAPALPTYLPCSRGAPACSFQQRNDLESTSQRPHPSALVDTVPSARAPLGVVTAEGPLEGFVLLCLSVRIRRFRLAVQAPSFNVADSVYYASLHNVRDKSWCCQTIVNNSGYIHRHTSPTRVTTSFAPLLNFKAACY
jgi:hypothetical protein